MKTINVLQFICPAGFYGAEMWILALAKSLNSDRVNCQLAVTEESEDQNLEVFKRFESLGLKAHKIQMNGRFDFRAIAKLKTLMQDERIDVLHTHGYKSDILGLLAGKMAGVKSVATPHGFENANDLKLQTFIKLGCLALRYFDRTVPLSEELMADMARIRVPAHKTRLIRNVVDLQEVSLEKKRGSEPMFPSNNEKRIGYVGQIAHRKKSG